VCNGIVLSCISLMTYDMEHVFIYLSAICLSSFMRFLLRSLAHFLTGFFLNRILRVPCMF